MELDAEPGPKLGSEIMGLCSADGGACKGTRHLGDEIGKRRQRLLVQVAQVVFDTSFEHALSRPLYALTAKK
jgi:hypothetical protein